MNDNPVFARIQNELDENEVVLFMKGTPIMPQCGFSARVVAGLSHLGVKFKGVNVLADADIREGVKQFSNWPTVPQLYIKGEFIGGCDIFVEMFQTGELQSLLKEKGIETAAAPA